MSAWLSGTSWYQLPFGPPGCNPAACICRAMYATVLSSPDVAGPRPRKASEASDCRCAARRWVSIGAAAAGALAAVAAGAMMTDGACVVLVSSAALTQATRARSGRAVERRFMDRSARAREVEQLTSNENGPGSSLQ